MKSLLKFLILFLVTSSSGLAVAECIKDSILYKDETVNFIWLRYPLLSRTITNFDRSPS